MITGFWSVEVKLLGPVQLYVAPVIVDAVSESVFPSQMGPLFPAVGALGKEVMVTTVLAAEEVPQPGTVTVQE